jgi:hypothetical protein
MILRIIKIKKARQIVEPFLFYTLIIHLRFTRYSKKEGIKLRNRGAAKILSYSSFPMIF